MNKLLRIGVLIWAPWILAEPVSYQYLRNSPLNQWYADNTGDLIANFSKTSFDIKIYQELCKRRSNLQFPFINLSGKVETKTTYLHDDRDRLHHDLLGTQLHLTAALAPSLFAHVSTKMELARQAQSVLSLERALISMIDETHHLQLTIGRFFVPIGLQSTLLISSPLQVESIKINRPAVKLNWSYSEYGALSIYATQKNLYGMDMGYQLRAKAWKAQVGCSLVHGIVFANGYAPNIIFPYATLYYQRWTALMGVLTSAKMQWQDLRGVRLEGRYRFDSARFPLNMGLAAEEMYQSPGERRKQRQYGVVLVGSVWPFTYQCLEFKHGQYNAKHVNQITLRLGVYF